MFQSPAKSALLAAISLAVTACSGSDTDEYSYSPEKSPEEIAEQKARVAERDAELAAIEYPECGDAWDGETLSSCGKKRLETSLAYCHDKHGSGYRLDPLSAGDSWISRAGLGSMQTIDERAARIRKGNFLEERISYASGNGTNSIRIVHCTMDPETLRVTYSRSRIK